MKIFLQHSFFISFFMLNAFAGDVEVINSMHGGKIKKTESALVEFVQTEDKANIYVTGHDKKNLASDKLTVSAIANIQGKEFPINVTYENDHYSLTPMQQLKQEN